MDVRTKALHRAAELVGGVDRLRELLGASSHSMNAWMSGELAPPMSTFLTAVDIISNPPTSAAGERRTTRARARELRRETDITRAKLAATRERARAICDAVVAGRLAAASTPRWTSALAFLETKFAPKDGAAMVDAAVSAAVFATGSDMGTLQLLRPQGLLLVAQRNFKPPFLDYFGCVTHEGTCGAALQKASRVIVEDVQSHAIFAGTPAAEVMASADANAVQSTPLVSPSGELLGVISTHYDHSFRPGARELDVIDHIARRTAFWLDGGGL